MNTQKRIKIQNLFQCPQATMSYYWIIQTFIAHFNIVHLKWIFCSNQLALPNARGIFPPKSENLKKVNATSSIQLYKTENNNHQI